jgi:predicted RNA binding protein YcfA (HicA-like mRNA interferase family)
MKIPRDLTAYNLIKFLKPLGYEIIRQKGSHIRIMTEQNGEH